MEIGSEPWSWSKVTTELDFSSYPVAYCGQWDFLFWLVVERQDFQDELGLSAKQRDQFESAKAEISELRGEFADSLRSAGGAENADEKLRRRRDAVIKDLANRIEDKVRELLTREQAIRLQQLARQDQLARYPKLTVLALGESYAAEFHSVERAPPFGLSDRELGLLSSDVERKSLRSELGSSVTGYWLKGVLEEQAIGKLEKGLSEFGLQVVPLVEIVGLENLQKVSSKELKSKRSMEELWNLTSTIVIHPTGKTEWRIADINESGDFNLLMSLATGPTFARYLELTHEQVELAQTLATEARQRQPVAGSLELRRNQKTAMDSETAINRLLLPFQHELLEERTVWREVEIFGIAPCINSGRLRSYLDISSEQKKHLMTAADITLRQVNGALDSIHKKRMEMIRSRLETEETRRWFDSFFGEPPQKITFRY